MPDEYFTTREAEIRFFLLLVAALACIFAASFIFGSRVERGENSMPTQVASMTFPPVELQAKAAYVYDARTQTVLFAKDENERLPLASLTKVMTALVAEEISPSYGTVKVTQEALRTEGDSGLKPGEKWSLRNLLDFSLVSSSNDGVAAVALSLGALNDAKASDAEIIDDFVRAMNKKAAELHLKNTYFFNETGLDESKAKGGAYGTAKDMATLLENVITYHPQILEATRETAADVESLDKQAHLAKNTNVIAGEIPGLIASKTGFTDMAGGNLAFAFDPELGRPIIVTVLGSTADGRFEDAKKLISATFQYINGNQ